ncbi:MAG: hypothetical protein ABJX32_04250 [Tateyamaria sp.]|uniref:hypothetical protein n=1 Tax=Tateyamaria sp. TaxID=1929288 RepID=UPI0032A05A38
MGVVSCLTALGYRHLTQLPAYQRFLSAKTIRPEPYQSHLSVFFSFSFWVMAVFLFFSALYFSFANDIFSRETLTWINLEDGFLETLSAVILIVASGYAVAVALGLRGTPQTAARLMHYFLAMLFFAMAGEEISWGQRYIGFDTPDNLQGLNVQNEVNLHNMFGYVFDHLFILLFFVWGCVVPLLNRISRFFAQIFGRTGLPIPGAGLAVGMLFITLTQEQLTDSLLGQVHRLRVPELRELLSAIAFLLLMIESYRFLVPKFSAAESVKLPAE